MALTLPGDLKPGIRARSAQSTRRRFLETAPPSGVQEILQASSLLVPGQGAAALELRRAAAAQLAVVEARSHREACEAVVRRRREGLQLDEPKALRAVRTNPVWMAQSATVRDSNALTWPEPTRTKTTQGALAAAGATSMEASVHKKVVLFRNPIAWEEP